MSTRFHCGRRISYDGDLCTVRYVGAVKGTKGEWLGVEWDDPSRGKHNGQHGGVEYFKCASIEPRPASFVRPTRVSDPPVSFVQAVKSKYASDSSADGVNSTAEDGEAIVISGKTVEEVGFDKIRRQLADIRGLRIIVLDESRIGSSDVHVAQGAGEACPNVFDLDMSRNLLEAWSDVVSIVRQLPRLSSLKLDGNRFSSFDVSEETALTWDSPPFTTVKTLSLEDCLMQWSDIAKVTQSLSSLTTLAAGGNQINELGFGQLPRTLTHLSLERNLFESLDQLYPLSSLPNLQSLNLKGNHIHSVSLSSSEKGFNNPSLTFPPALQHVDLSVNEISSWHFITALPDIFSGLKSLRTSSNPLYQSSDTNTERKGQATDGYMLTVARISGLESLNFSPITPKLRLDAELFYLSQIAKELASQPKTNTPKILAQHPRYAELTAQYGAPTIDRNQSTEVNANSLAAHLLKLTFVLDNTPAKETSIASSWETEIPDSFSIYNILGMLGSHFELYAMHLRLIWETDEEEVQPTNLDVMGGMPVEQSAARFREEKLEPKTRSIGSWLEGKAAKIRVEWDEEERRRSADVKKRIEALMR